MNELIPFGGAIRVRMMRKRMNIPTMAPNLYFSSMIFTVFFIVTRSSKMKVATLFNLKTTDHLARSIGH